MSKSLIFDSITGVATIDLMKYLLKMDAKKSMKTVIIDITSAGAFVQLSEDFVNAWVKGMFGKVAKNAPVALIDNVTKAIMLDLWRKGYIKGYNVRKLFTIEEAQSILLNSLGFWIASAFITPNLLKLQVF